MRNVSENGGFRYPCFVSGWPFFSPLQCATKAFLMNKSSTNVGATVCMAWCSSGSYSYPSSSHSTLEVLSGCVIVEGIKAYVRSIGRAAHETIPRDKMTTCILTDIFVGDSTVCAPVSSK